MKHITTVFILVLCVIMLSGCAEIPVPDTVVDVPANREILTPSEGISGADSSSELENDASEKKSPVGTWELIGTYYGWENEEELTQPVPLEKLSIWDGERITFTVYGDRIDFFGHVSKWSYENDEFRCSLETDYPQLGALYYVDENTMHYSLRGDIEVYKRVDNNTNNGMDSSLPAAGGNIEGYWEYYGYMSAEDITKYGLSDDKLIPDDKLSQIETETTGFHITKGTKEGEYVYDDYWEDTLIQLLTEGAYSAINADDKEWVGTLLLIDNSTIHKVNHGNVRVYKRTSEAANTGGY